MKVFLIYEEDGYMYDTRSTLIGFVKDEESAKSYIAEKNKPYDEEYSKYKKCQECRKYEDDDIYEETEMFRYSDICEVAEIKNDRNGEYCENDLSGECEFDNPYYWYMEADEIEEVQRD